MEQWMFKLNKTLIKRGFKSLSKSKVFSILMMVLIFLSGATYTMLSQSGAAFSNSYNYVTSNGKLQDYVIKSGFTDKNLIKSNLSIGILYKETKKDADGKDVEEDKIYVIPKDNSYTIDDLKKIVKQNDDRSTITLKVNTEKSHDIFLPEKDDSYSVNLTNFKSFSDIENDPSLLKKSFDRVVDAIDKTKSEIINKIRSNLSEVVTKNINETYGNLLSARDTKSVFVQSKEKAFNVVQYDSEWNGDIDVNNMVIYDGTYSFTKNLTKDQFIAEIKNKATGIDPSDLEYAFKGYKYEGWVPGDLTGKTTVVTDPNAYQAIVSPSYANQNGKKAIAISNLVALFQNDPKIGDKIATNAELQNKYKDNLVFVDATPYFIIGVGIQPNYMYPVINGRVPVVDPKNQAIVFVSKRGYLRVKDAFRANPTEDFISIKFKSGTPQNVIDKTIGDIKNDLISNPDKPVSVYKDTSVELITTYDDPNDQLLLTQERVTSLQKVKVAVMSLSYATTTLLIIFVIAISIMVFKTLIAGSRKIYATLHSLGYTKLEIAVSNALSAFVLVFVPIVLAYGVGYGFQFLFINQFSNIWTIPTYGTSFSWVTLVVMIGFPTIILFLIILTLTIYELKYTIPEILSDNVEKSYPIITNFIAKIKFIGIKGKYVTALSFKNIGKLTLIVLSSLIAMTAMMVGFGTLGRSNYAYNQTISMNKYEFAVNLVTPTVEGGQYEYLKPYDANKDADGRVPLVPTTDQEKSSLKNGELQWHIPQINDTGYVQPSTEDSKLLPIAHYLKNKLQSKAIISIGEIAGVSPWDIAERLMPDNQRNEANQNYNELIKKAINNNGDKSKTADEILNEYSKDAINIAITKYFNNEALINDSAVYPYTISYNQVLVNETDEMYTHIDGRVESVGEDIVIKGISHLTNMISLNKGTLEEMRKEYNYDKNNVIIPVLINKYLEAHWGVTKGDLIDMSVNNSSLRFQGEKTLKVKLKIVDIVNGYNNAGIYTEKSIANKVLHLPISGFNGVFSKSKAPNVLRTLPLYSPSGIYASTDSFSKDDWKKYLDAYIASDNWENQSITSSDQFIAAYTSTPYTAMLSSVRWNAIDKLTFKNITKMTSTIISIIEVISISLSVMFIIIVGALLFRANRQKIAAMWTLGYRKKEIVRIFLSMYVIPIIIATAISLGFTYGILAALKAFIINFGNILIPLAVSWWIPFAALGLITILFVASTYITIYSQGSKVALEAFKGD